MRGLRVWALVLLVFALPSPARAEDPPQLAGVRIIIPTARGKSASGRTALTESVRSAIEASGGKIVSAKKLSAARKKLKQKGKARWTPEGLAEAAREVGADYVLALEITKDKWIYTAKARLVRVDDGEVAMSFKSQYFKPKEEAEDRGNRIAMRTVQKLVELGATRPKMSPRSDEVAVFAPDTRAAKPQAGSDSEEIPEGDDEAKPADKGRARPEAAGEEPRGRTAEREAPTARLPVERVAPIAPPTTNETPAARAERLTPVAPLRPREASQAERGDDSNAGRSSGAEVELTPGQEEPEDETVRLAVQGGADLLRSYDLSSPAVNDSRLSYRLQPLAMISAGAEARLAHFPLGFALRGSFRPVRFAVTIEGDTAATGRPDAPATPSGRIFDVATLVQAPFALRGSGREAFRLLPGVGVLFSALAVDRHRGDVIVSSRALAPIASVIVRMPFVAAFEADVGLEGGPVVAYKESPGKSGTRMSSAFVLSANLRAWIWLSELVAITLDSRFDYGHVRFVGVPSRFQPEGEDLENVSSVTKDLQTGIGVAVRL